MDAPLPVPNRRQPVEGLPQIPVLAKRAVISQRRDLVQVGRVRQGLRARARARRALPSPGMAHFNPDVTWTFPTLMPLADKSVHHGRRLFIGHGQVTGVKAYLDVVPQLRLGLLKGQPGPPGQELPAIRQQPPVIPGWFGIWRAPRASTQSDSMRWSISNPGCSACRRPVPICATCWRMKPKT